MYLVNVAGTSELIISENLAFEQHDPIVILLESYDDDLK